MNNTVTKTFRCTGCDQEKDAKTKETVGQAKTRHHCGNCGEETVWLEQGWVEIEVE